jgi:hypothetical protein
MAQDLLQLIQETSVSATKSLEEFSKQSTFQSFIDKIALEYFLDTDFYEVFFYNNQLCLAIISTGTLHPLILNSEGKYLPGPKIATFTVEEFDPSHHITHSMIDSSEVGIIYSP